MKYFITGGQGFIGFHLTNELLKDPENTVVSYDAQRCYFSIEETNWAFYQQYRYNQLAPHKERITRIRGDMTDKGLLRASLEKQKPDIIIHLAALPIALESNKYPEEAKRDVLESTDSLVDVLRQTPHLGIKRLVHTSSSMVYGDFRVDEEGRVLPATEDQPCNPRGNYGVYKRSGEDMVKNLGELAKIPFTIIRPSGVYGPTACNHPVTELYVDRAFRGLPLVLENGGTGQIDFSYVKDVARGFVLAAKSEKAVGQTFNIACGDGRSIKDLAQIIAGLIPGVEIVEKEAEVFRSRRGTLNITKARTLLGFNPEYSLEKGVAEYVEFYRNVVLPHYEKNTPPNMK